MFKDKNMSVINWWVFYILMIIPLVNIIVFLMILFSSNANKSLKSYVWAGLIPVIGFIAFAVFVGVSPEIMNIFDQVRDLITEMLPIG